MSMAWSEDARVQTYDDLHARVTAVRGRIQEAAERAGRSGSAVTLVAVTKTHPPELAQAAVDLGVADLGENRVHDLLAKMARVQHASWHLVGQLQSRKARDVVGRAVLVHSVDRRSLVDALSRRAGAAGVVQRLLVQVDTGEDPHRGGCHLDEALDLVAYARERPHLVVEGLMTMPPVPPPHVDANEAARPHFATLRGLRDEARQRWPEVMHLSMGMSADLEAAVAEGATMVRVGEALFGPRHEEGRGPSR